MFKAKEIFLKNLTDEDKRRILRCKSVINDLEKVQDKVYNDLLFDLNVTRELEDDILFDMIYNSNELEIKGILNYE